VSGDKDFLKTYPALVARLRNSLAGDAALEAAVGGDFITVGKLELALLQSLGLKGEDTVVDVGCGSGRLAFQLAAFPGVKYLGTDVVPDLLAHAAKLTARSDWRLVLTNGVDIPCGDESADFICFFSVFTHLTYDDTFRYLRQAKRVLKPGGRIVFSFLEFYIDSHWAVFANDVENGVPDHLNQFIERGAITAWCKNLGLRVESFFDGDTPHIPIDEPLTWHDGRTMTGMGALGQSVAVLTKL
jgi:SAM-dependent methyltransferase